MLTHPCLDQLHALGLHRMAKAIAHIEAGGDAASLDHAEWLALLLEREASLLLRQAAFRSGWQSAMLRRPASRTSTIATRAASTAASWSKGG